MGQVDINKTLSANQDGDAIGGSVNLHMRQATSSLPTLELESLGGYNPIDEGQPWFRDDATVGKRFGANQRFGVMFSYSYDLNDIGTDDVEPVPVLAPDNTPSYNEIAVQEYLYNHTRYGFGGSMDYKVSDNSDLFVHGLFTNFKDYGQKYTYDIQSTPEQPDSGSITYSTSVRRPNYQISDLILGGNQVFSHSYIRYVAAVSHSREGGAAGNPGADFAPNDSSVGSTCGYSAAATKSVYRPQFPCAASDPIYDPSQYSLQDINLTTGQATQINLQGSAAMGIDYHLGSHASILEFGAQVRNAHKGQDALSPTYDSFCDTCTAPPMTQFTTNFKIPPFTVEVTNSAPSPASTSLQNGSRQIPAPFLSTWPRPMITPTPRITTCRKESRLGTL